MSLEECIVKALKDNLGVAIQVLGPEISAAAVNQAQEKYFPTLSLSARSTKTENAAFSYLDSPGDSTINRTQNYNFLNASQGLPTGGTLSLGFTGYRTTTNSRGITIDPRYGTTLSFNLTQPLLRNFGLKVNRREILVANNNLGVSEENLKNALIDTVYNVESAYWNLVYSIENLDVRRQSLKPWPRTFSRRTSARSRSGHSRRSRSSARRPKWPPARPTSSRPRPRSRATRTS